MAIMLCAASLVTSSLAQGTADEPQTPDRTYSMGAHYANEPIVFADEHGVPAGVGVDLLKSIAASSGLKVRIELGSAEENKAKFLAGKLDGLVGLGISDARGQEMTFSAPYLSIDYVIFVHDGSSVPSINALEGKKVIVRRGDVMHEYCIEQGLGDNITVVDDTDAAIRLLARAAHDCAIVPKLPGEEAIRRNEVANIAISPKSAVRTEYAFAARRGDQLAVMLSDGISEAMTTGADKEIYDSWLYDYENPPPQSRQELYIYGGGGLAVVILIVLLSLLFSRLGRKGPTEDPRVEQIDRENWELRELRDQLLAEKESLISLLKNAPHGVAVIHGSGASVDVVYLNEAASRITGFTLKDCRDIASIVTQVFPEEEYRERLLQRWQRLAESDFSEDGFTVAMTAQNGEVKRIDLQTGSLGNDSAILMFSDVTERYKMQEQQRLLDEQIRQSQKLEAMGQLAGGVAHDFNNLLTSISGNAQLLQMDLTEASEDVNEMIDQILGAARRAGELTKQLLAYARKGKYQIVQVDAHDIIGEVAKLLQHSINRLITIELDLDAERPMVMGDPSQIQSALLNLGVNARDAMIEDGGSVTYSTRMTKIDAETTRKFSHDISPGEYIEIKVCDTGCGMTKETIERMFEPFYTTKEQGKGTGLGLAAVYGCVKNHHGAVGVESAEGAGTTFSILLPTVGVQQGTAVVKERNGSEPMVRGKGHVLLVDDEEDIRRLTGKALRKLGYRVTTQADGALGVEYYKENAQEVDLVILDMIMPNMDGRTAFTEMKKINPEVRVLVVSGFASEENARQCMHEGALDFIAKPFWIGDLSQAVGTYIAG